MKQFEEYLRAIGVPEDIQTRIDEILEISKRFLNVDVINDIYISEYMTQNSREFESLWIYTNDYVSEAKNFRNTYNLDEISLKCKLSYLNIVYEKYDFMKKESTSDSRMTLNAQSSFGGFSCLLKGSGNNCEYLHDIFNKYYRDII